MGRPVLTACASCYARLRTANHKVRNEPERARSGPSGSPASPTTASVEVHHVLDVLVNHFGLDGDPREGAAAAGRAARGLLLRLPADAAAGGRGLRRCRASRRAWTTWWPPSGAEPVEWPYKTECCGASLSMTALRGGRPPGPQAARRWPGRPGAECIAVACPLCQVNLDLRQADAAQGPRRHCPKRRSSTSRNFSGWPWGFRRTSWASTP